MLTVTKTQRAAPAAALSLVSKSNAVQGYWTRPDFVDYDSMAVYRYANSTDAAAETNSTFLGYFYDETFVDFDDDLTIGTTYYYRIAAVDTYGHESVKDAAVNITYAGVIAADIEPLAIKPSKLWPRDFSNLVSDPEMVDPVDSWSTVGCTVFNQVANSGALTIAHGRFKLEFGRVSSSATMFLWSDLSIPVEGGVVYNASIVLDTLYADDIYFQVEFYDVDTSGMPNTLLSTVDIWHAISTWGGGIMAAQFTAHADAQVARIGIKIVQAASSTITAAASTPVVRRAQAAGSINTTHIVDNAITAAKIAADAVGSSEIAAGAVGTSEIADGAVTATKIAAGAVDASHIAAGAVDTSELATDAVTSAKIAASAVDTSELANNAVTVAKIANGAVTSLDNGGADANLSIGTTYVDVSTLTVDPADCRFMIFSVRFIANAAGTFDIQVRQNTTEVFLISGVAAAAGELVSFTDFYLAAALPNASSTFVLRVKRATGTANISYRRFSAINVKK